MLSCSFSSRVQPAIARGISLDYHRERRKLTGCEFHHSQAHPYQSTIIGSHHATLIRKGVRRIAMQNLRFVERRNQELVFESEGGAEFRFEVDDDFIDAV